MCEFCTKHGDGQIWYKNAKNYAADLLSDIRRRGYIRRFVHDTIYEGFMALGRLEDVVRKKGVLPERIRIAMEEKARLEHFGQVLPIEEVNELLDRAETIVRMPCACRWAIGKGEVRACYGISMGPEQWYRDIDMSAFGPLPDAGLESVSKQSAIQQMKILESHGAMHTIWTMVTPFIGAICNCTLTDCLAMRTLCNIKVETVLRAEFVARVDQMLCIGCGLCAQKCQFHAIHDAQTSNGHYAIVDALACYGCGLCRNDCPTDAISLMRK
jgi:Pyruvate/2-oxoacid:ferredoxin oxidoreductase delta subunit